MNEQEFLEFKLSCQQYKDRVIKLENITESQESRIIELEKRNDKTDFQYEQIMKTLDKLINTTIPDLTKEIQAIKSKPAERYNTITTVIITTIVGGIIGYIIKFFT